MSWQHFEQRIRDIASIRWNCNAVSETIAGIKCDCILKLDSDNWIAIEITEECNLEKVRSDIVRDIEELIPKIKKEMKQCEQEATE